MDELRKSLCVVICYTVTVIQRKQRRIIGNVKQPVHKLRQYAYEGFFCIPIAPSNHINGRKAVVFVFSFKFDAMAFLCLIQTACNQHHLNTVKCNYSRLKTLISVKGAEWPPLRKVLSVGSTFSLSMNLYACTFSYLLFWVLEQLICAFVFAYAKSMFFHGAALL